MSSSNLLNFERYFFNQKNMYEPICDVWNFSEYSLEISKMAVFLVESRHQLKFLIRVVMLRRQTCVENWFSNKK